MAKKLNLIIHHKDLDGVASALAIIQSRIIKGVVETISWNYGDKKLNYNTLLSKYKKVYIVDINEFPIDLNTIKCNKSKLPIEWYDHHELKDITNIKEKFTNMTCYFNPKEGSCCGMIKKLTKNVKYEYAKFIKLADIYDSWQSSLGLFEDAKALNLYCKLQEYQITDEIQKLNNNQKLYEVIQTSRLFNDYLDKLANDERFEYEIINDIAIAKNPFDINRCLDVLRKRYPFVISESYDKEKDLWLYSLRSDGSVDCSKIAKSFGGGGHIRAAGFSTDYELSIDEIHNLV